MLILGIIVILPTLCIWAFTVAAGLTQHGSDAAGNGMGRAFAAIGAGALWILLAILLLIGGGHGQMPPWSQVAALLLVPASAVGAQISLRLMIRSSQIKWPAIVLIVAPALMIFYAIWCFFPSLQQTLRPVPTSLGVWITIGGLSVIPSFGRFFYTVRDIENRPTAEQIAVAEARRKDEERRQIAHRFHSLTSDSSLRDWWEFTEPENVFRTEAFNGARLVKSRQEDAVNILQNGKRSLFLALPQLDLKVTPQLELAFRAYLDDQVTHLMPYDSSRSITTKIVTDWYEDFLPIIEWLVENGGSCNEQIAAMAQAVRKYPQTPDREIFLARLEGLRTTPIA